MNLDQIDVDILDAAYHDEPWHILCGMVADRFADIRDLVPRVLRLQRERLVRINRDRSTTVDPTAEDLEEAALKHEEYGTTDWPDGAAWSIETTEKGAKYVE